MNKGRLVANALVVERACGAWETGASDAWVDTPVQCRSGVILGSEDGSAHRAAYLSAGSPLERVLGFGPDVRDRSGIALSVAELANRLVGGEVAALVTSGAPAPDATYERSVDAIPSSLRERQQGIRRANVRVRFLLRQLGLEEVASHNGAPTDLYHAVANEWTQDLALCTDPAMLLSLGADRQRYVDDLYVERATDRLPRALLRLQGLGVRSYPRLVIV